MKLFFKRHSSSLTSFDFKSTKNPSTSESQILRLCKLGELPDALRLLNSIKCTDIAVKPVLYASLLQTCTKVLAFNHGLQIHAHVLKSGLETDRFVGNSLLSLYFKLNRDFSETRRVFDGLFVKDVISWTSMISGYIRAGKPWSSLELFWEMLGFGIEPNGFTLSAVIKACSELGHLRLGRCFHGVVVRRGFDSNHVISSALIDLYGKNYESGDAHRLFDELPEPDVICWTSVISALTRNDLFEEALGFFYAMQRNHRFSPDEFTCGTVLTACGNLGRLKQGKEVHAKVFTSGLGGNVVVESSLLDMYGKCGSVDESQRVFDRMPKRNSVSWSALLGVYCQNRDFESVIKIFREMEEFDLYCLGTVLRACAGLAAVRQGKEVHAKVFTSGLCGNVVVESSLLDMYGKCGLVDESQRVFDRMPKRNSVSWSAFLGVYCQNGDFESVIKFFREMEEADLYCLGTVLRACAGLAAVRQGKEVHCQYVKRGGWRDVIVESALVGLYAKCGCISLAYKIFTQMPVRNLITWNSMICGFAQNGKGEEALRIFHGMIKEGIKPNYISFIGVLFACSHTGLVDQGRDYFVSMTEDYGIKAGTEHYNCMVYLLGRAGLLEEAENLIENGDCKNDSSLWAVLLGACTTCTNPVTAERIAKKMMELKPDYHMNYVLLANVYSAVGRWSDASEIRRSMEDRGVKKMVGKSWIESNRNLSSHLNVGSFIIPGKNNASSVGAFV